MKNAAIVYTSAILLLAIVLICFAWFLPSRKLIPFPEPVAYDETTHFRININTATVDELQIIPSIGPSLAEKIISYRNKYGPFQNYSDLLNVSGIGNTKLEIMLDYIIIE